MLRSSLLASASAIIGRRAVSTAAPTLSAQQQQHPRKQIVTDVFPDVLLSPEFDKMPAPLQQALMHHLGDHSIRISLPVQWGDMDAFNHVNNVVYFRYFETARLAFIQALKDIGGLDPKLFDEFANAKGVGPIISEAYCRYRSPVTFPDILTIGVKVGAEQPDRIKMELKAVSHAQHKLAAEHHATAVMFDYRTGKKAVVSDELRQAHHKIAAWSDANLAKVAAKYAATAAAKSQ
ncbi:hypothetical protein CAOG_05914 [Capsaspora owczarzaki ATCC 30864]|uniref:Thioesterase superfamily protein n=1 Tax=Capsaspora owczarzaki (strain ATCC 30864) TaxID=595528 RepID=A0A0D2WT03_CAPO3|nr:hypothetical protein CAOG_05914 [Capsaspora owczarzaki ATCC 30864]KJE95465.1 hypothetical protein CAOG_005914 [Capsaspora owczarzaki ATCC 30864]|eukprot:XP_004345504.1 hypothetical protein CAOG_05914 [Capsaspora owczarzaki ATCC 30864]